MTAKNLFGNVCAQKFTRIIIMDTKFQNMIELRKKYKSGSALEILQDAILRGDVPDGTTITQLEVAQSLGTSRMPVREALIAMEYQGLIERLPGQHVKVSTLDDDYIRSIFADLAALEIEAVKILPPEKFSALSLCNEQMTFHRTLRKNITAPFRRKSLEILTEIFLAFVLEKSENAGKIDAVFLSLLQAMNAPRDIDVIRAGYAVYSEVLASEFIRIRRRKKHHAEFEAG